MGHLLLHALSTLLCVGRRASLRLVARLVATSATPVERGNYARVIACPVQQGIVHERLQQCQQSLTPTPQSSHDMLTRQPEQYLHATMYINSNDKFIND